MGDDYVLVPPNRHWLAVLVTLVLVADGRARIAACHTSELGFVIVVEILTMPTELGFNDG